MKIKIEKDKLKNLSFSNQNWNKKLKSGKIRKNPEKSENPKIQKILPKNPSKKIQKIFHF